MCQLMFQLTRHYSKHVFSVQIFVHVTITCYERKIFIFSSRTDSHWSAVRKAITEVGVSPT